MEPLNVLIVDDDTDLADSLAELLDLHGCRVAVAYSGEEAVATCREKDFDFAFIDIRLPNMSGVESCKAIHAFKPDAKLVLMTAYNVDQFRSWTKESGALRVVQKPFDMLQVFEAMRADQLARVVLVADDDVEFAKSVEDFLTPFGYTVLLVRDGREAVDRVIAGDIDVLLLDLGLPGLNGAEVCRELEKRGRAAPTVIVTAYADAEAAAIDTLNSLSVNRVIRKPFRPEDLLHEIEALAQEG